MSALDLVKTLRGRGVKLMARDGALLVDAPKGDTGLAVFSLTIDMGAYEFQPAPVPPSCPEDTNGDGAVNVLDLIEVLLVFGTTCP